MAQTDPLIGATAGNYTLEGRLGSGGMGDVYRGVQRRIGAKVAIKILHATADSDPEGAKRFQIEAQAGNRIEHPGVIKVIDAGQLRDGRPYLVMPLLEGHSLADHLVANPRLPIRDACRIAVDVLDAVAAAHGKGFIHRDLKPPNVFLTTEGKVVLLDFGVAKLMASDSPARLTRTGTAIGTPYYMAPEQIREHGVGPASDIYAVGVVLFEMLCGRRPFDGQSAFDVMAGHLEKRPPPPRALRPDIPLPIQDVVLTALAKKPERRFPTAAAMRDALIPSAGKPLSQSDVGSVDLAATIRRVPPPPGADAGDAARRSSPGIRPGASGSAVAAPAALASAPAPRPRALVRYLPWLIALAAVTVALGVVFGRDRGDTAAPAPAAAPAPERDASATGNVAPVDARGNMGSAPRDIRNPVADELIEPGQLAGGGEVEIRSKPGGAVIVIEGVIVGTTPLTVRKPAGAYRLELRLDGYRTAFSTLTVTAGAARKLDIPLAENPTAPGPKVGIAVLESEPPGAAVSVDGTEVGRTPVTVTLASGRHEVVMELAGYARGTGAIVADSAKLAQLFIVLKKRRPSSGSDDRDAVEDPSLKDPFRTPK